MEMDRSDIEAAIEAAEARLVVAFEKRLLRSTAPAGRLDALVRSITNLKIALFGPFSSQAPDGDAGSGAEILPIEEARARKSRISPPSAGGEPWIRKAGEA